MRMFPQVNLQSKVNVAFKILVALLLSALLLVPTLGLALDYNSTVQSYVSNARGEINGILTLIRTLKGLPFADGQTALAEIDQKLASIQTNASKNAADFQKLSDDAQKRYEDLLDLETLQQQVRDKRREIMKMIIPERKWYSINLDSDNIDEFKAYEKSFVGIPPNTISKTYSLTDKFTMKALESRQDSEFNQMHNFENRINSIKSKISNESPEDYKILLLLEGLKRELFRVIVSLVDDEQIHVQNLIGFAEGNIYQSKLNNGLDNIYSWNYFVKTLRGQISHVSRSLQKSSLDKQAVTSGITLTNKISQVCNDLDKRIDLAKQKFGNVKEYASALNSFSDPDVLNEITELDKFMDDLTKNL